MRFIMILLVILAAPFVLAEEDSRDCPIVFPPACAEGERLMEFDNDGCTDYRCENVACPIVVPPDCNGGELVAFDNDGCTDYRCETIACTADAKVCPDGSTVGRTGPNCEFAACPDVSVCSADAKLCPDGTVVGRTGPNCEFAACPEDLCTTRIEDDGCKVTECSSSIGEFMTTTRDCPNACPGLYAPVCGQPPMPPCLGGLACPMMMPGPTTYDNKCFMEAAGAEFLYDGTCGGFRDCNYDDPYLEYESKSVDECSRIRFTCDSPNDYFSNSCGCGCEVTPPDRACGNNICEEGEASYCPPYDCKDGETCPAMPCYEGTCPRDCRGYACPENCECDSRGNVIECKDARCGNGICERGEDEVCATRQVYCVKAPCPPQVSCQTSCPEDCDDPSERYVYLNDKFKLELESTVLVKDHGMEITFRDVHESRCSVREVYATPTVDPGSAGGSPPTVQVYATSVIAVDPQETTVEVNMITGNVVDSTYSVKTHDYGQQTEVAREVIVDSAHITKCRDGDIYAALEVNYKGRSTYVKLSLGERKVLFGTTVSFLDYYSRYKIGVFLVSQHIIDCPARCICSADGSVKCPTDECPSNTQLCPDGVCKEHCGITEECTFGCIYNDGCLPIGTRVDGEFCSISRDLETQLGADAVCENNFECGSNLCIDSQCVEPGLFKRLLSWFGGLF